jgi:hypothetical protein
MQSIQLQIRGPISLPGGESGGHSRDLAAGAPGFMALPSDAALLDTTHLDIDHSLTLALAMVGPKVEAVLA